MMKSTIALRHKQVLGVLATLVRGKLSSQNLTSVFKHLFSHVCSSLSSLHKNDIISVSSFVAACDGPQAALAKTSTARPELPTKPRPLRSMQKMRMEWQIAPVSLKKSINETDMNQNQMYISQYSYNGYVDF